MAPTLLIQTVFDGGSVYGVDTDRMMLSVDEPEEAVSLMWSIIESRGLIPVADGEFERSVSFHPDHVLSVHVLT